MQFTAEQNPVIPLPPMSCGADKARKLLALRAVLLKVVEEVPEAREPALEVYGVYSRSLS